jgi:SprT protein
MDTDIATRLANRHRPRRTPAHGARAGLPPARGATPRLADEPKSSARVRERTAQLLAQGAELIARPVPALLLSFDLRGQAAGQFRVDASGQARIRYNAALMLRHEAEFLAQTVPHEVAHYLAFLCYGRGIRPHGPQWQQLMRGLGAEPRRCHDLDVSDLRVRRLQRHPYYCACGEHALTSIRHHRVLRGARYICRRCGEVLRQGAGDNAGVACAEIA